MVGMRFRLLGPKSYFMPQETIDSILARYPNADIDQSDVTQVGLADADFAYTDVWTSMGQEAEMELRQSAFQSFQLNSALLKLARNNCKILHCLPARRGEEITDEVIDGNSSLIVEQAGNRMHAQKGLLIWLALQHDQLSASELEGSGIELPLGIS